jgi:predicted enzyme related to lactoylglutathione lyase
VLEVGRLALIQDPGGAVLALWEARSHAGADVIGQPGALGWAELVTPATAAAVAFYGGLFGWAVTALDPMVGRAMAHAAGRARASLVTADPAAGGVQAHWLVHFSVDDCDGRAALVQSLGGRIRIPPRDIAGLGRVAVVADPMGARFALVAGEAASFAREG